MDFHHWTAQHYHGAGASDKGVAPSVARIQALIKKWPHTYLVKVILVQLPNEAREVGVLEHAWKNGLREFIDVFDHERVPLRCPEDDVTE